MRRVYLDNNSTTPLLPEVRAAIAPYFEEKFGNASSIHHSGQQARAAVERARGQVAGLLGARASEIVFTSGGTEADNLAIFGVVKPGDHIISSVIEHHAVINSCKRLEEMGCDVTYLPVDSRGLVNPDDVRRSIKPGTRLVTIMMANNETGVVEPVDDIGRVAAEAGILFHTDAVQAAGKIPVKVDDVSCSLLSLSGHKLHGLQGTGALFVRRGVHLQPQLFGGNHERSRRAGTENVLGIVGLGEAARLAAEGFQDGSVARTAALRNRLENGLMEIIEDVSLNGAGAPRVPNTTNLRFNGIEGEGLVISLDLKGLAVSTGAACSSGAIEPSHVLTAMGLTQIQARSSVRLSLGKQNSEEDVDAALALIPDAVARLRALSPSYNGPTGVAAAMRR